MHIHKRAHRLLLVTDCLLYIQFVSNDCCCFSCSFVVVLVFVLFAFFLFIGNLNTEFVPSFHLITFMNWYFVYSFSFVYRLPYSAMLCDVHCTVSFIFFSIFFFFNSQPHRLLGFSILDLRHTHMLIIL